MTLPSIEYRLVPAYPEWVWPVYAGQDGSILVYKPERRQSTKRWLRLNQTRNENGYWKVSIRLKHSRRGREHDGHYVYRLVTLAFRGPPIGDRNTPMHGDSDGDNNEEGNLSWGTKEENARHEELPHIKAKTEYWNAKLCVSDLVLRDRSTLPVMRGKCLQWSEKAHIWARQVEYAAKWQERGVSDIISVLPEKQERGFEGFSYTNEDGDSVQLPEPEAWYEGNGEDTNTYVRLSDGRVLSSILVWHPQSGWVPFKQRFCDAFYSNVVNPVVPCW